MVRPKMRFKRHTIYHIRFWDHNESDETDPRFILNVVGKYVRSDSKYVILENWWPEDPNSDGTRTKANILKKAIIQARELK